MTIHCSKRPCACFWFHLRPYVHYGVTGPGCASGMDVARHMSLKVQGVQWVRLPVSVSGYACVCLLCILPLAGIAHCIPRIRGWGSPGEKL